MNDLISSIIRTVTPLIVGQVLSWLALLGINDAGGEVSASLIVLVTTILTTIYYSLARLLERKFPSAGWLLGLAKAPKYEEK